MWRQTAGFVSARPVDFLYDARQLSPSSDPDRTRARLDETHPPRGGLTKPTRRAADGGFRQQRGCPGGKSALNTAWQGNALLVTQFTPAL